MHPLHERILAINRSMSEQYVANETARLRYWAKHPTFVACIKCMDGRVHFASMTKTPVGIVKPFRAIGGKFRIWWPSFIGRIRGWTNEAIAKGSRTLIFVTYHFSQSNPHLSCAGWKYDTAAARAHAEQLRNDLAYVFGEELTAIVAGVETDRDVLLLHSATGDLSGERCIGKSESEIRFAIRNAFPAIPETVQEDLIPFLVGNALRVQELTEHPRNLKQKDHNERIIAVGQGFDWLNRENLALIINDADPNLAESVRVAADLIQKNLEDTPPGDDATIFTNVVYRSPGIDYRQAVARSRGLLGFVRETLAESHPELFAQKRLHALASVKWEPSKKIEIIEES